MTKKKLKRTLKKIKRRLADLELDTYNNWADIHNTRQDMKAMFGSKKARRKQL